MAQREPSDAPGTAHCPLCGEPNGCALATASPAKAACWCAGEVFPAGLLERVPERLRGRACICRSCLEAASSSG